MAEMDSTRLVRGSAYLVTQSVVTTIIGAVALKLLRAVNENDMRLIRNLFGKKATAIVNVVEKVLV